MNEMEIASKFLENDEQLQVCFQKGKLKTDF